MNGVIIIKKDHMGPPMDHYGPETMLNVLNICDCILTDKSDGDEVEVTVKGTLMEHDGMRFIAVDTVDGEHVEDLAMNDAGGPNGPNDTGNAPSSLDTTALDAVNHFFNNYQGK